MRVLAVFLPIWAQILGGDALGFTQSVAVRGKLLCNGAPSSSVRLKLFDVDTFDIDDLMAEGYSDSQGNFFLAGQEREFTNIDPKLNIYHNCNDYLPCDRKIAIVIPDSYVSNGAIPYRTYDAGVLNLDGKFSGESRDCLNR